MSTERRRVLLCRIWPRVPQPFVLGAMNPLDKSSNITLAIGKLIATQAATNASLYYRGRCTPLIVEGSGLYYWETKLNFSATSDVSVGLTDSVNPLITNNSPIGLITPNVTEAGIRKNGNCSFNSATQNAGGALTTGVVIRHLYDSDTRLYQQAIGAGSWYYACGLSGGVPRPIGGTKMCPSFALSWQSGATPSVEIAVGSSTYLYGMPDGSQPLVASQPAPVPTAFYLASEQFNTDTTDPVPVRSKEWMSRISRDSELTNEREATCWVWGGDVGVDRGSITVLNKDSFLDSWLTYEWRDALCEMFSGYAGDTFSAFTPYSTDIVDTIEYTVDKKFNITLASQLAQIDRNMQTQVFPDNQANASLAGKPLPIVIGRPLYCSGSLLDTSTIARNYQAHDAFTDGVIDSYLVSIDQIYDRGNIFIGPNDSYTFTNGITAALGGSFATWTGTPAMPAHWHAQTLFGTTSDRFTDGGSGTMHCQSGGQMLTVCYNDTVHRANTRFTVSFTCTTATLPGTLRFRVGNVQDGHSFSDAVITVTGTGIFTGTFDTDPVNAVQMQLILGYPGDGPVDVIIDNLTTASVQVADWTYWVDDTHRQGFHLANSPQGKIVCNPVGPDIGGTVIEYPIQIVQMLKARAWNAYGEVIGWDYNTGTVAALQAAFPYRLAAYIDTSITFLQFWRNMMDCYCGWVIPRRDGQFVVGNVQEPSNTPELFLDQTNCIDVSIAVDTAPGLSQRMSGGENNTVHDTSDLYSTILDPLSPIYNPALAQQLMSKFTITKQGAPTLTPGVNPPTAGSYAQALVADPKETMLMDPAHIQQEINRVCTMWRQLRYFITVTCILNASEADQLEPGDTVNIVWPYIAELSGGVNCLVKRVKTSFFSRKVELTLWCKFAPAYVNS